MIPEIRLSFSCVNSFPEIFCPAIIPNGQLPEKCIPKVDVSCLDYKCSQGYEKNKAVTSLNCTIDGVWNTDITTLCKGMEFAVIMIIIMISLFTEDDILS